MAIQLKPSPNFSSRHDIPVVAVLFHYDASPSESGAISWMCNPASKVSAHYHVGRGGNITQLVDPEKVAWHAGVAMLPMKGMDTYDVNLHTIGIELGNLGRLDKLPGDSFCYTVDGQRKQYVGPYPIHSQLVFNQSLIVGGWWEPFRKEQMDGLRELLQILAGGGYREAVTHLFGHDEIAIPVGRKIDPGAAFPWQQFARQEPRSITSLPYSGG